MTESELHERLRVAAGERTYRQLGSLTRTNAESVRRYMHGQAPSVEFLAQLCTALGLNGDWLLTGQGPMLQSEIRDHALRDAGTPDLLRAMSDTVSALIDRVDRLERFVQTAETRLRFAGRGGDVDPVGKGGQTGPKKCNGDADERGGQREIKSSAGKVSAAISRRSSEADG